MTHYTRTLPGLLLRVHGNQITVGCQERAGHLKSRQPFPRLWSQVLSLRALLRDPFGGGWKNHSSFLRSGRQKPPHAWSADDPRLQNDGGGGERGLGLGGLSSRSETWPSSVTRPVLGAVSSGFLRNALCPAVPFPLDFSGVFPGAPPGGAR